MTVSDNAVVKIMLIFWHYIIFHVLLRIMYLSSMETVCMITISSYKLILTIKFKGETMIVWGKYKRIHRVIIIIIIDPSIFFSHIEYCPKLNWVSSLIIVFPTLWWGIQWEAGCFGRGLISCARLVLYICYWICKLLLYLIDGNLKAFCFTQYRDDKDWQRCVVYFGFTLTIHLNSDQAWIPAELKHISKRRKRN